MKKYVFLYLFLYPFCLIGQQTIPHEKLQKVMAELVKTYKIPNAAVGITHKDGTNFYNFHDPTNENSMFLIGSNTKSFTALSILQLADTGLVDIDAPVKKYLPWFSFKNETAEKHITVRHLLNQTGGFPQTGGFFDMLTSDIAVFETALNAHIKTLTPVDAVNAQFQYCNLNYMLLGLIVQKASGMPYKDYVQQHIFKPLGMSHSFADYKSATANGLIQGYQHIFFKPFVLKTPEYSDFRVPQGYIASTTSDLLRYLEATMKNVWGLKEKSYKDWITPYKDNYAMGWGETHYFGQPIIQHLGLTETFNAALFFMPKQEYGVVVLANMNSNEFNMSAKEAIILTLLDKPYTPNPNMENVQRGAIIGLLVLTFLGALFHFVKWKNADFQTQKPKILRGGISLVGIALSVLPFVIVPKLFGVGVFDMAKFFPDYGYGFVGIAVFGVLWALVALVRKRVSHII
jgi:CubicO group peptidase (beta-lactamase class C family)